ncbi:hypothetical protein FKP32DRAFT_1260439 [Trametes sanguinea]|nr:hypothetical protein FKP32DRAFT_1260439 [Trametes sanguinea]
MVRAFTGDAVKETIDGHGQPHSDRTDTQVARAVGCYCDPPLAAAPLPISTVPCPRAIACRPICLRLGTSALSSSPTRRAGRSAVVIALERDADLGGVEIHHSDSDPLPPPACGFSCCALLEPVTVTLSSRNAIGVTGNISLPLSSLLHMSNRGRADGNMCALRPHARGRRRLCARGDAFFGHRSPAEGGKRSGRHRALGQKSPAPCEPSPIAVTEVAHFG